MKSIHHSFFSWVVLFLTISLKSVMGTDIINVGIVLPCLFYLPENSRLYYLYSMQYPHDLVSTMEITGLNQSIALTINFCTKVTSTSGVDFTNGAPYFRNLTTNQNYSLSFFNDLLNTTMWKVNSLTDKSPEDGVSITGNNTVSWAEGNLFNPTFELNCAQNVEPNNYNQTLAITAFDYLARTITISLYSSAACGYLVPKWISTTVGSQLSYQILSLVIALLLLFLGFMSLKVWMGIWGFLTGLVASAVMILEGSNPNLWNWVSMVVYGLFALIMAICLSKTGYKYPSLAMYSIVGLIGYFIAVHLSQWLELYSRLIAGYYALQFGLPILLAYLTYKHAMKTRVFFTALVGAVIIVRLVSMFNLVYAPNTLPELIDVKGLLNNSKLAMAGLVFIVYVGCKVQWKLFRKYGAGHDNIYEGIEELMDE